MRNLADNFIETAYLKEKNEEHEYRENYPGGSGYYLGESKYHGWIVKKTQIYDRKRFIEEYGYTAGQKENICISRASEAVAPTNDQTVACYFTIIGYSEKSVAIFGYTKAIKEQLAIWADALIKTSLRTVKRVQVGYFQRARNRNYGN
ncbi:MAG: hypothetical protein Q8N05_12805 [Bacteroidota bacterium]|nr:hypothetical protein [Bacteroidota bacterium]